MNNAMTGGNIERPDSHRGDHTVRGSMPNHRMPASTGHRRWAALGLLAVTQFMVILDQTVVTIALPSIGRDLGMAQASLSWVINAYVLTFGGFLLLGGRAADLFGQRRMFMTGLGMFAAASLVGGFSPSQAILLTARAFQGIGAAIVVPSALASVTAIFPEGADRNRAIGIWAGAAGSGGAIGVILGGLLTGGPGWPWIFWINVPVGLASILLAPALLNEIRAEHRPRHLDLTGAATVTIGVSLLVYGIVHSEQAGWASARTWGPIAIALLALLAFVTIERHTTEPLMHLSLFRVRALAMANSIMVLFAAGVFTVMFFLSLYLQQVLRYSPLQTGLAYIPLATGLVFGPIAGWFVNRTGARTTLITGLILVEMGAVWFSLITPTSTFLTHVFGPSILIACGGQFTVVSLTLAAVHGISAGDTGIASGIFNTSREIGSALGVGALATVAIAQTHAVAAGSPPDPTALTGGFRAGLTGSATFVALALILALAAMRRTEPPSARQAPQHRPETEETDERLSGHR